MISRSLVNLGVCCEFGRGVKKDPVRAAKLYRSAADQGDRTAQCNLGYLYETGEGVEQNLQEAVKWYTRSAEQGSPRAQYHLAWCYEHASGVQQDLAKALSLYEAAAAQQYEDAEKQVQRLRKPPEKGKFLRGLFGRHG